MIETDLRPESCNRPDARLWRRSPEHVAECFREIRNRLELESALLGHAEDVAELLPFAESVHVTFELRQIRKALGLARARIRRIEIETLEGGD